MPAHMIVRSIVPDAEHRPAFDRWYGDDHMAEAVRAFSPSRCWRSWSDIEPSVHYAFYEFETLDALKAMTSTDIFAEMVADFTRIWDGKVTRERDFVQSVQIVEKPAATLG